METKRIIEEEATEDMEKMAAILPSDKSYFRTGIFETFKSRIRDNECNL